MRVDYDLLERQLNEEVNKILVLIKEDYYDNMSDTKKEVLENLLRSDKVVIVNKGVSKFNDNTLAHGGRTLRDGKIHFYPDVREFDSNEGMIEKCRRLLPHECFHYFIQPDELEFNSEFEIEMARFYTEGLIEREARRFFQRHNESIPFEKANYGFNIKFANMLQSTLGLSDKQTLFTEDGYLRNIGMCTNAYETILKRKNNLLDAISQIAKEFLIDLQRKVFNKMRTMLLQDGDANAIKENLKTFAFISTESVERLDESKDLKL